MRIDFVLVLEFLAHIVVEVRRVEKFGEFLGVLEGNLMFLRNHALDSHRQQSSWFSTAWMNFNILRMRQELEELDTQDRIW